MKPSKHKARLVLAAAAMFLLFAAIGCSTNQSIGEQIDDATITAKIKAKLAGDPEVNALNVDVDTQDRVVRLSGTVEKETARREAAKIARRTRGVKRVENDLEIGRRTMGERLDDAAIVTKIKAKLTGAGSVNSLNVDVDSKEGVVTLSGKVESDEARDAAERIAKDTEGVVRVHNKIEVIDGRR